MSCFRFVAAVVCSFSLLLGPTIARQQSASSPYPSALIQQSLAAFGNLPSDSSALGSVSIVAGSEAEVGSIQIQTRGVDQSSEQVTASSGSTQTIFSHGAAALSVSGKKSLSSLELTASSQTALFPFPLLAYFAGSSDSAYQYVGTETVNGTACQHIRVWKTFASQPDMQYLASFTARDIWLDSTTNLPLKIAYSVRAGTGAVPTISVEIFYSGYQLVNGVQYPFLISKSLNGTPWMDITISSVSFNTGLTDSSFPLR